MASRRSRRARTSRGPVLPRPSTLDMRTTNTTPTTQPTAGPTHRLTALPTYVFAWLDELKAVARAGGAELIDLGIGNPDQPTPRAIVETIARAYSDPRTHGYPPFRGTPRFREAAATFMKQRFGVRIDSEREVLCTSGG